MDIFLSYANEDREFARRLAEDLDAKGIDVWRDATDIKLGENFVEAILNGIRNAPNFVALISKHSPTSPFFSTELAAAIAATEASRFRRIVPLIIEKDAALPPFLSQFQALDVSTPERYQTGIQKLGNLIKEEHHQGPLPTPDVLKQYELLVPGMAERMLKLAEEQQLTRLRFEQQVQINGRILGLLAISALAAGLFVAYLEKGFDTTFLIIVGSAVVSLFSSFVAGFFTAQHRSRELNSPSSQSGAAHGD